MSPRTRWIVQHNFAYDALCLLNVLTGDSFYTEEHPGLLERWQPRLTPDIHAAFERVAQTIRHDWQSIISSSLCFIFSSMHPRDLNDLERAILEPATLVQTLQNPLYGSSDQEGVQEFERLLVDLLTLVRFLKAHDFESECLQDLGEHFTERRQELQRALESFDVVSAVERALGRPLDADEIEVFTLAYTAPHGIKLIGNRFITSPKWSAELLVGRVAVHELMHPPFDTGRPDMRAALAQLVQNTTFKQAFDGHDPILGYNTWEGYVEENCVRALDQVISERFGIAQDATQRFAQEDGGMHVLAAHLMPLLRARVESGSFEDWFVNQVMDSGLNGLSTLPKT